MIMKKTLLATATLILMGGCATKAPIATPTEQSKVNIVMPVGANAPSITIAPDSSVIISSQPTIQPTTIYYEEPLQEQSPIITQTLIEQIESLRTNQVNLNLTSNHNIRLGSFLNITVQPNLSGYLNLIIIDPYKKRSLALPNGRSNGYIRANQRFSTNNSRFALKATNPTGLHQVVVVFSEKNPRMIMKQGQNGYDAIANDQDLIDILERIHNQEYGRSHISVFSMRIY